MQSRALGAFVDCGILETSACSIHVCIDLRVGRGCGLVFQGNIGAIIGFWDIVHLLITRRPQI